MEITSKPSWSSRSLACDSSSAVRSMMFFPPTTRSSAPVMPMGFMALRATLKSGENSSVIAAILNLGVIMRFRYWRLFQDDGPRISVWRMTYF